MKKSVKGKVFVITGSIGTMRRMQIKAFINREGGNVFGAVMNNTDYLITNGYAPTVKIEKARELGVTILSMEQFVSDYLPDGFILLCPQLDYINDALLRAGFPAYGKTDLAFKALQSAANHVEGQLQILKEALEKLKETSNDQF